MKKFFLLLAFGMMFNSFAQTTVTLDSTVLQVREVIGGINIPWEIIWGPDGYIWMTERHGRVSRVNVTTGAQQTLLDISAQVYEQSEAGMLGMALHPDFANEPYVYVAYNYSSGGTKLRIARYTYNGTALISPFTLIENIPANSTHSGCRMIILPDTTLLFTMGDAQNQWAPQDVNELRGKVHRLNLDGSIPANNPIPGNPAWSWGVRNTQGLLLHPNGILYSSEHGPTQDDELNILMAGRNYGWPTVNGFCNTSSEIQFCNDSNVVEPLVAWTPTIAPSDLLYFAAPNIPELEDRIVMAVLKDARIIVFDLSEDGEAVLSQKHYLINQFGRIRDLCMSPDGKLYIATNGTSWSNTNPFTHKIIELSNPTFSLGEENALELQLWPNPCTELLNISGLPASSVEIQVYDAQGRMVKQQEIRDGSGQLNVQGLDAGWYSLSAKGEKEISVRFQVVR
jgi:glucose/arabinose dehydrogenase